MHLTNEHVQWDWSGGRQGRGGIGKRKGIKRKSPENCTNNRGFGKKRKEKVG